MQKKLPHPLASPMEQTAKQHLVSPVQKKLPHPLVSPMEQTAKQHLVSPLKRGTEGGSNRGTGGGSNRGTLTVAGCVNTALPPVSYQAATHESEENRCVVDKAEMAS